LAPIDNHIHRAGEDKDGPSFAVLKTKQHEEMLELRIKLTNRLRSPLRGDQAITTEPRNNTNIVTAIDIPEGAKSHERGIREITYDPLCVNTISLKQSKLQTRTLTHSPKRKRQDSRSQIFASGSDVNSGRTSTDPSACLEHSTIIIQLDRLGELRKLKRQIPWKIVEEKYLHPPQTIPRNTYC